MISEQANATCLGVLRQPRQLCGGLRRSMTRLAGVCAALLLSSTASVGVAQDFPVRPIRLMIPYPPGGTTDLMARTLQEPLQKALGQTVLIVNDAGATGTIGTRKIAQAAPDGYSVVLVIGTQLMVTPLLVKEAGHTVKDFAPVGRVAVAPLYAVINGDVPANDLEGFIAYARKQPNGVEYASSGIGSTSHLATEMLARSAGIKLLHVPYKGTAPATQAVLTGEAKLVITSGSSAMTSYIASGKLKLLGISSAAPSPLAPGARPIGAVVPGYGVDIWWALFAPAATPPAIIAKLNDALRKALALPELQASFEKFGVMTRHSGAEELRDAVASEAPRWARVVQEVGLRAE